MKPLFWVDGLSDDANGRVLSVSVKDEAGFNSDTASIRLDNRDYKVSFPPRGRIFEVKLGYVETGLVLMGKYQLDTVKLSHGNQGAVLDISANAQFHHNNIKSPREDNWEQTTFGQIVSVIADRNGYTSEVDPSISDIFFDHVSQNESDMAFVQRLAEEHDAFLKYQDGKMMVVARQNNSVGNIVVVSLTEKTCLASNLSATVNSRNKYESVRAYWQNPDAARRTGEVAGSGEPEFKIQNKTYSSKEEAALAASAKLKKLQHGQVKIDSLSLVGDPRIRAGTTIIIDGFIPQVNGEWEVSSANHQLDGSGYRTNVTCEGNDER